MDIFNAIKEWLSGLFGDTASNVTNAAENLPADDVRQQASDAVQGVDQQVTDAVEQLKNNVPGQQ